jgi:hypothetical protein
MRWLRFPIAWAETGQYGTLLVSPQAWRGLAYHYQAAGAPEGAPSRSRWWYSWSGTCFVPHSRIDPPRRHHPTIWGSLAWSFWWAWYPSIFIGWGLTALFVGPDGANQGSTSVPAMVLAVVGFWGCVHWLRWLRRSPR